MNEYKPKEPIYDQKYYGDQEFTDPNKGLILISPDGTRWRVLVDNTGAITNTSL